MLWLRSRGRDELDRGFLTIVSTKGIQKTQLLWWGEEEFGCDEILIIMEQLVIFKSVVKILMAESSQITQSQREIIATLTALLGIKTNGKVTKLSNIEDQNEFSQRLIFLKRANTCILLGHLQATQLMLEQIN
ncbi:hypothetical protein V6N13_083998 [Hibiscus sabdariffa]